MDRGRAETDRRREDDATSILATTCALYGSSERVPSRAMLHARSPRNQRHRAPCWCPPCPNGANVMVRIIDAVSTLSEVPTQQEKRAVVPATSNLTYSSSTLAAVTVLAQTLPYVHSKSIAYCCCWSSSPPPIPCPALRNSRPTCTDIALNPHH